MQFNTFRESRFPRANAFAKSINARVEVAVRGDLKGEIRVRG